jgi:putative hydrolase of the HAD superfamily
MTGIQTVAFDIDGTLYAEWRLYGALIPYVLKHFAFFRAYRKVRKVLRRSAPLADLFEYQARLLAAELRIPVPAARSQIENVIYRGLTPYFEKIPPRAGCVEAIWAFKSAGLKIALLSDFPPAQKGSVWGIRSLCDAVLGSEEIGALKPSKYAFGNLSAALGVPCDRILYVGNSVAADIRGAKNAGMKTAYIMPLWRRLCRRPLPGADISFRTYRQLQKLVLPQRR